MKAERLHNGVNHMGATTTTGAGYETLGKDMRLHKQH